MMEMNSLWNFSDGFISENIPAQNILKAIFIGLVPS